VTSEEVRGWPRNIWHPQMTMHVATSQETIVQTLLDSLNSVGYRVTERDPGGFRAQRVDWLDRVMLEGGTTVLVVRVQGSDVMIHVDKGAGERGGRRRAARGLSAAIDQFRLQQVTVQTTEWGPPPQ
jgi:hypothetical protein